MKLSILLLIFIFVSQVARAKDAARESKPQSTPASPSDFAKSKETANTLKMNGEVVDGHVMDMKGDVIDGHVMDMRPDVIKGTAKGSPAFVELGSHALDVNAIIYKRPDFNDFENPGRSHRLRFQGARGAK